MIPAERMKKIMEIIEVKKYVSIKELSSSIFVSISTIRRDLIELEKAGLIVRTRGGAGLVNSNTFELSSFVRSNKNIEKKKYIANIALDFVSDNMSIFVDASSTVQTLCHNLLNYRRLILITNSSALPYTFNEYENIQVYSSGGLLKPHSNYFIGTSACLYLSQFSPDLYFMSCKSIDEKALYDADYEHVQVKRSMLKNAKKIILLVDSTKFGIKSYLKISELKNIDYIITDKKPIIYDKFDENIKKKFIF